ncbi:5-bromo-4-chloroindolyl phosphate hydrolysis family protein [Anianabacter salinae]|uniref:5-bromo-4-chloroindolyl phosphate hydrolysis family protein n=1 Tax=Anianabacter salinae TaxID=2851023 RepID=UPI00225E2323|nr:5-bromo-4-chloroindolyl phosphate hydrolysis family protein [Anianabacter salinae]MBV0913899.1 5-bromo-4-chloroindolyl phosphate hydrolysis family protein [Anianabacter salinae]
MAQRYGGKHSPGASTPQGSGTAKTAGPNWAAKRPEGAGMRTNLLFILPFPLIWRAFTSGPVDLAFYLAAFGVLILAAWLTREGVIAQGAYDARKVAKRPAIPRKIFGSILTGAGLGLAGFAGHGLMDAILFGAIGVALHQLSFGLDPLSDKGAEGVDSFQSSRVARAVEEAEKHLTAMRGAVARTGDRWLEGRVERFQDTVRELFRTVEDDPRDLTAARKYLGVYLMGARDATFAFADIYNRTRDPKALEDFTALLDDLETNFAARTETLLADDRTDLDIEIGVLRDRLAREGVKPTTN